MIYFLALSIITQNNISSFCRKVRSFLRKPLKALSDSKGLCCWGEPLAVQLEVLQTAHKAVHRIPLKKYTQNTGLLHRYLLRTMYTSRNTIKKAAKINVCLAGIFLKQHVFVFLVLSFELVSVLWGHTVPQDVLIFNIINWLHCPNKWCGADLPWAGALWIGLALDQGGTMRFSSHSGTLYQLCTFSRVMERSWDLAQCVNLHSYSHLWT